MKSISSRLFHIDLLKLIGIYLVIIGHAIVYGYTSDGGTPIKHPVWEIIYSFHMPLFMMASGIFATSALRYGFLELLASKLRQLIIPAVAWTVIRNTLLFLVLKYSFTWEGILSNLLYDYWFLKSLFFCYLIFWGSMKLIPKAPIAAIVSILVTHLIPFFGYVYIDFMLPYFWAGYFLSKEIKDKHSTLSLSKICVVIALYLFLMLFWKKEYTIYEFPIALFDGEGLNRQNLIITIYRFILGLIGSIIVIKLVKILAKGLDKATNVKLWISRYGQQTLGIYLLQQILIVVLSRVYTFNGQQTNVYLFDFFIAPIYGLICLAACILALELIGVSKFARHILLGSK